MNYTENYHLPQWIKSDRIMMDDFNAAMSSIETGLTGNAQTAEKLGQNSTAQEKRFTDRMLRLAYNHYCAVQDMEPRPGQIGVFYQDFEKDPSGLTGATLVNGHWFAGKNSVQMSQEVMAESYQVVEKMKMVKNDLAACTPMKITLRAPASGQVNHYGFQGHFTNSERNATYRLRIKVINQDTGGVEQTLTVSFTNVNDNAGFGFTIEPPLYFLGGINYLITMEPLDAVCDMEAWLVLEEHSVGTYTNQQTITAQTAFHEPLGGTGGMAILHCIIGGEGGDMDFLWDGVKREPYITRTAVMGDGRGYNEFIFLRDDPIGEDSTLSLRFDCRQDGCVQIHDWGMMLF
ncbi:MAG: hypothetical protein HDT16_12510 [Oscillibacter sp.]|nr:hypothetical protein [Oscillibacter sp.]